MACQRSEGAVQSSQHEELNPPKKDKDSLTEWSEITLLILDSSILSLGSCLLLCCFAWLPQCCALFGFGTFSPCSHSALQLNLFTSFPSLLYSCQLFQDRAHVCENFNSLMWRNFWPNIRGDMGVRSLSSRGSLFEIISITRANC